MNRPPERDDLLEDVLGESAPADFREALLADTLRLARSRRWRRRASRAVLPVAIACAIGSIVWSNTTAWRNTPASLTSHRPPPGCEIIHTRALAAEAVVTTRPFAGGQIVGTIASVDVVRTKSGADSPRLIDDRQLLALAARLLPALVRTGPDSQELILVRPPATDGSQME